MILLDEDMLLVDVQLSEAFLPQLLGSSRLWPKAGQYLRALREELELEPSRPT